MKKLLARCPGLIRISVIFAEPVFRALFRPIEGKNEKLGEVESKAAVRKKTENQHATHKKP
jgi:hypothetical protein